MPKIYAITHAEGTARAHRGRACSSSAWRSSRSSGRSTPPPTGCCAAIGVDPKAEFEEVSSSDDLKLLIARSQGEGKLDPGEAVMLSGVFHLHEQEARQVMTPIPAVVTVDVSETVEAALRRCIDSGHTRLLVTEDQNTDRIRGIVHINSLAGGC